MALQQNIMSPTQSEYPMRQTNETPLMALDRLITFYRRRYGLDRNQAIAMIRRDAQSIRS